MRIGSQVTLGFRDTHCFAGLLKLVVRASSSKSIRRNLEATVYELLCEGVPVSTPIQQPYGVNCSYMTNYLLNQYMDYLCDAVIFEGGVQHTLSGNPVAKWLVNSMAYNSLCSAIQINIRILSSKGTHTLTSQLVKYVTSVPVLRLKTLSAKVVYAAVSGSKRKLSALPLPNSLKTSMHDIIFKQL